MAPLSVPPLPDQGPTQEKGLIRTVDSFLAAGIDLDGVVRAGDGGRGGTGCLPSANLGILCQNPSPGSAEQESGWAL